MMKEFKITLDLVKSVRNQDFLIKTQEANNIKLLFTLLHDEKPVDLTNSIVSCYVRLPSGAISTKDCTLTEAEEGNCEVILDSAMYAEVGNYEAELRLIIGNELNITEKFYFHALSAIAILDRDGDGIPDTTDPYPDDPTNTPPPNKTVALVTQDKANLAATVLRDALTATGYTVTLFNETEVTATNLTDFGLIALTRYSGYENSDTATVPAWYAHITGYLDGGKPLMLGRAIYGTLSSGYLRSLTHVLGIGKEYYESSTYTSIYRNRTHAIDGTTGNLAIAATGDTMSLIFEANGYSGTDIAVTSSALLNQKRVLACEKGLVTTAVNSKTLNARVVYGGFIYNRYGYSADGQAYIGRIADWLLNII